MESPLLGFLHLSNVYPADRNVISAHLDTFAAAVEGLLDRSRADNICLRITDPNLSITSSTVLERPQINVHRLEIRDINQILRLMAFKKTHRLPSKLQEIVAWQKPDTIPGTHSPGTLDLLNQPTVNQCVTVYIPDARSVSEPLEAKLEGPTKLCFVNISEEMATHMLWETGRDILDYKDMMKYRS